MHCDARKTTCEETPVPANQTATADSQLTKCFSNIALEAGQGLADEVQCNDNCPEQVAPKKELKQSKAQVGQERKL